MKTRLETGKFYSASRMGVDKIEYFRAGETSHDDTCIFLSMPPAKKGDMGRGIYHWVLVPGYRDHATFVKEETAKELSHEEVLKIAEETGWKIFS